MAIEIAAYEDVKKLVVHRSSCKSYSSVARTYQTSSIVKVPEGWWVVKCGSCEPDVHVVTSLRRQVTIEPPSEDSERWENKNGSWTGGGSRKRLTYWRKQISKNSPDSSFPPYGVVALDITHSENRDKWEKQANCKSDDTRLNAWLAWLYQSDHTEHWTLTIQKVICSQCPVRVECLEQGVWGYETWGVWGGATERERKLLRAKWILEGRVDERPDRPHGYGGLSSVTIWSQDGSRATTPGDDEQHGVGQGTGEGQDEGEGVPGVRTESEVRWPRTYSWPGVGRGRTRSSDW